VQASYGKKRGAVGVKSSALPTPASGVVGGLGLSSRRASPHASKLLGPLKALLPWFEPCAAKDSFRLTVPTFASPDILFVPTNYYNYDSEPQLHRAQRMSNEITRTRQYDRRNTMKFPGRRTIHVFCNLLILSAGFLYHLEFKEYQPYWVQRLAACMAPHFCRLQVSELPSCNGQRHSAELRIIAERGEG
jgi:hypothetical protein